MTLARAVSGWRSFLPLGQQSLLQSIVLMRAWSRLADAVTCLKDLVGNIAIGPLAPVHCAWLSPLSFAAGLATGGISVWHLPTQT